MSRPKNYGATVDRKSRTLFVVACEGERSEEIYLRGLTAGLRRVELLPLSTVADGRSAPRHLLDRIREWKKRNRVTSKDDIHYWLVLDVDHHFAGRHAIDTHAVLNEANRVGVSVAISNPRFEVWLLLHLENVTSCPGQYCEERLRMHLG